MSDVQELRENIVAEQATGVRGAGAYREAFREMGYPHLEVVDWASSAGDWTFIVSEDGARWYIAWQSNNYPHPGFTYGVESNRYYVGNCDDVLDFVCEELAYSY